MQASRQAGKERLKLQRRKARETDEELEGQWRAGQINECGRFVGWLIQHAWLQVPSIQKRRRCNATYGYNFFLSFDGASIHLSRLTDDGETNRQHGFLRASFPNFRFVSSSQNTGGRGEIPRSSRDPPLIVCSPLLSSSRTCHQTFKLFFLHQIVYFAFKILLHEVLLTDARGPESLRPVLLLQQLPRLRLHLFAQC
mmetsp:Transcript_18986/g.38383  ORF Transcript_18986/g.38383 Transcript_18986/m.38383 type:complete len:197 (+) Transcript_18986:484-1074(+)